MKQEQQDALDDEPTCASSSSSSTRSTSPSPSTDYRASRQQQIYQYMIHPALVATEEPPQAIAIVVHSSEDIPLALKEIMKHTSIKNVTIVTTQEGEKEEEETVRECNVEIQKQIQQQQQHSQTIKFKCTSMIDLILLDHEKETPPLSSSLDDVVILFPNLDGDDQITAHANANVTIQYFHRHLSPRGVLVTYLGPTLPLSHVDTFSDVKRTEPLHASRYETIGTLNDAKFERIVDYDIPLGRFPMNIGVAFKSHPSMAHWRLNEPLYNLLWAKRTTTDEYDTESNVFDGATMMTLLHPPKHSALSDCSDEDYDKYGTCDFHGYDPQYPNVDLGQLYVSKSGIGDNAGRGVFTNVDIVKGANIGLETTVYSVQLDWVSFFSFFLSFFLRE
jgi:hypothetical protein